MGTNAAGLKSKQESFFNLMNKFEASIITIQETKLTKVGTVKIPGYQTFEKIRKTRGGGGLLTVVHEDLEPVLVSEGNDDIEILVVEGVIGSEKLRIINGYGPQEDDDIKDILTFWQEFEAEIMKAKDNGCLIIAEMDANAKLGSTIIKKDPNEMSNNGRLLMDIIERQNLIVANCLEICKGTITRQRELEHKTEKSVIDYIVVCQELSKHLIEVSIDEDRVNVLERFVKKKSGNRIIPSDHNILFGKFEIAFTKKPKGIRKEFFKFKCESGRQQFLQETSSNSKLSSCFLNNDIKNSANLFFKTLNRTFHKCFKKIRIRNGNQNVQGEQSIQGKLKIRKELKVFILNSRCKTATKIAIDKLNEIEKDIIEETATKNATIVKDYINDMDNEGEFSNLGFWKLKRKLCPPIGDPPMAKKDKIGNIITAPECLKNLYVDTYRNRLKNREMKEDLMDIYYLKTELWETRNEYLKTIKTKPWEAKDLEKV